tara:strand:- start:866 stop:1450 length:585 start_codon:yes stop_codon:yes gene_type:complete
MNLIKNQIILASSSPRRKFFFEKMQLDFIVKVIPVKEKYPPGLNGIETARHIAHKKSEAFFEKIKKNQLVITADTIVWHKNKPLGKPSNSIEAKIMLKKLSNSSHEVITAVCFLTKEKIEIIHEVSTVTFGQVSENEINDYIETGSPFDKAGSYGIQDPFGIRNIVSINGSYTNIIGLPVAQVLKKIKEIIIEN